MTNKLYLLYKDQSAVLVEFNVYSDMPYYDGLTKCLAGGDCLRMIMISDGDDSLNINVRKPRIFSLMVMQLRPQNEIVGLREIVARNIE